MRSGFTEDPDLDMMGINMVNVVRIRHMWSIRGTNNDKRCITNHLTSFCFRLAGVRSYCLSKIARPNMGRSVQHMQKNEDFNLKTVMTRVKIVQKSFETSK